MKEISRQRRWQLKKQAEGKCTICGKPAVTSSHCEKHRKIYNERSNEYYYLHLDTTNEQE